MANQYATIPAPSVQPVIPFPAPLTDDEIATVIRELRDYGEEIPDQPLILEPRPLAVFMWALRSDVCVFSFDIEWFRQHKRFPEPDDQEFRLCYYDFDFLGHIFRLAVRSGGISVVELLGSLDVADDGDMAKVKRNSPSGAPSINITAMTDEEALEHCEKLIQTHGSEATLYYDCPLCGDLAEVTVPLKGSEIDGGGYPCLPRPGPIYGTHCEGSRVVCDDCEELARKAERAFDARQPGG